MNITSAIPASLPINTANIPTESVQTQNLLAERIPESRQTYESVANRSPETSPNPQNSESGQQLDGDKNRTVNARQEGDPGQNSRDRQEQREQAQEQREVQELISIDRKVKAHEQAHSSVGGIYAGTPSYTYKTGPNGARYAVGGEVPIDISPVPGDPQATLRKAETVARAALAPADPSSTDRQIAAAASAMASRARFEIARQATEKSQASIRINQDKDNDEDQGPQPYHVAGTSYSGGQLFSALKSDPTEQVGGQVSASA